MKICIPAIMYKEHPYIWEYDQKNNQARCLFTLAGATEEKPKEDKAKGETEKDFRARIKEEKKVKEEEQKAILREHLINLADKFEGLEVTDEGEVIIKDARSFFENYAMIQVAEYKVRAGGKVLELKFKTPLPSEPEKKQVESRTKRSTSITRGRSLTSPTNYTVPPLQLKRQDSAPEKSPRKGLKVDTLIPNNQMYADIWGKTLCYESHLKDRVEKDSTARNRFINSLRTLVASLQANEYYPYKVRQIELIRELYDILDDLHDKFATSYQGPHPNPFYDPAVQDYFRDAIVQTMVGKGRTSPAQVKITLKHLLFFINQQEPTGNFVTCNRAVQTCLDELKQAISDDEELTKKVTDLLNGLTEYTYLAGTTKDKFVLLEGDTQKSTENKLNIEDWHSCYHLISDLIASTPKIKDKNVKLIVQNSITRIISEIRKQLIHESNIEIKDSEKIFTKNVPDLHQTDIDFYICQTLHDQLKLILPEKLASFDIPKLNKKNQEEWEEQWVSTISETVMTVLSSVLSDFKQGNEPAMPKTPRLNRKEEIVVSPRGPLSPRSARKEDARPTSPRGEKASVTPTRSQRAATTTTPNPLFTLHRAQTSPSFFAKSKPEPKGKPQIAQRPQPPSGQ